MNYRPFIILVFISLLFLVTARFGWWRPIASVLQLTAQPVLASETAVSRTGINFFTIIASLKNLARENAALRQQNNELSAEITALKEVKHENDILRQELSFIKESADTYIPAQLIGRTAVGVIKDLIVSRGSADGLAVGQAVVAQGYLIGTVSEVGERQSTIRLVSHPQSIIPTLLQNSRTTGLLRGGIGGLTMTDILIDATIEANEAIVTSGLGGLLPAGIPVGKVVSVTAQNGDITKRATVNSPVDIAKLEVVFVRKAQ